MKLTSKGRFAVMSLVDIAINSVANKPVSLSDISSRQKFIHDTRSFMQHAEVILVADVFKVPGAGAAPISVFW